MKLIRWAYIKRRWYDFKLGDSGYLRYAISFIQFIVLVYTLYIPQMSWLEAVFSSITIFGLSFVAIYIPLAVVIGNVHRKRQLKAETELVIEQNVVGGYNAYVGMTQSIRIMREFWGIEPSKEYLEMRDYWKRIAGDWKPKTT